MLPILGMLVTFYLEASVANVIKLFMAVNCDFS